ncbi:ABC transporter permease [Piscinibacter gummiphilus]|uniref:Sodium ABC transporter permease n=1 Tax=Piscinibacter gummiphilus TaxID=946333 RepID=A0A1W6LH64_9BURK|nr:ABC transporter permease [Piscinibacter gummiphilus]ARN23622.1 sodium ABC transporter permease [Piscinibacter gummiphilus]ATU68330.1 ABC transporter permease [Piscinibacter gummiphilus]GLS98224.1 Na+ ABC transporter permease [Piscinibacter gummiphilus]
MKAVWTVYCKEIVDALRDRRTLMVVLVSSVLLGPLVLIALSGLLAQFETQAEKRVVVVDGIEHAPTLRNFIERQTYAIEAPPADYEDRLRRSKFGEPVLVVPEGFEDALLHGDQPVLELVSDSGNRQAEAGAARVRRLVEGFSRERGLLALALRGVSAQVLEPVDLAGRDLASQQSRAAQLTSMLPFFVLMAVLYGALNAALDTTAGERERGSLEPLLVLPAPRWALVLGKWAAVVSVSVLIAVLSCFSFLPAQWLLRSDTLQALFQFGAVEAAWFVAVLLPLACALSALLMAVAIRCRTFKEAQASTSVLLLVVSMLPLVTVFNQDGEAPWHRWVPALAQHALMTRVLKGEALSWELMAVPAGVCVVLAGVGVLAVSRSLRGASLR